MANPLKVLTALSASSGAAISGSDGLVVNQGGITINNNGGLTVNSNGITVTSGGASITGQVDVFTGLVVHDSALQVTNGGISGSATLQIGGDITGSSGLKISGQISGSTLVGNGSGLTSLSASQLSNFQSDVRGQFSNGVGVTITNGSVAIGQAVGTTSNVQFAHITGSQISSSGGFLGDGSGLTNIQAASVAADSVQLGRDTTGNYVASITAGNGLTGDGTGEGSTPTLAVGAGTGIKVNADSVEVSGASGLSNGYVTKWNGSAFVNSLASESSNTFTIAGTASITGDLLVQGTTTTVNTENLLVKDPIVLIGSASNPSSVDVGLIFGASNRQALKWDHSATQFVLGATDSDGSGASINITGQSGLKVAALSASGVTSDTSYQIGGQNVVTTGAKTTTVVAGGNTVTVHVTGSEFVSGSGNSYVAVGTINADGFGSLGEGIIANGNNGMVLNAGGVGFQIAAQDGGGMGGVTIGAYSTSGETITLTGSAGKITLDQLIAVSQSIAGTPAGVLTTANYYSARNVAVAHNHSGSSTDVVFHFDLNPAASEGQTSGNEWSFHRVTGLSGSSESNCLNALGYASIDVMTRDNGVTNWTNDLVSVKVEASSSNGTTWYPKITVSAPALTNSVDTKIRLILVNESQTSVG